MDGGAGKGTNAHASAGSLTFRRKDYVRLTSETLSLVLPTVSDTSKLQSLDAHLRLDFFFFFEAFESLACRTCSCNA